MSRRTITSAAFHSGLATLNAAVAERRATRLTPPAPLPPRDSDPQAGEALPEHRAVAPSTDDGRGRDASLPPPPSAWAWADADSDDGGPGR